MKREANGSLLLVVIGACYLLNVGGCQSTDATGDDIAPDVHIYNENLRIGSFDSPDDALTRVQPHLIAMDSVGRLYIGQPDRGEVRIYDSDGNLVRMIGRRGAGPAEFSSMFSLGLDGGALYVANLLPARVTYFSLEGELLRTEDWNNHPSISSTPPFKVSSSHDVSFVSPLRNSGEPTPLQYLKVSSDGTIKGTLLSVPSNETRVDINMTGRAASIPQPFPDYPLLAIAPDGDRYITVERRVANSADTAVYGVIERDMAGRETFSRSYRYAPVAIHPDTIVFNRNAAIERVQPIFTNRSEAERYLRSRLIIPQFYPPVDRVSYGSDGTVWIRLRSHLTSKQIWRVLDQEGTPIREVHLPAGIEVAIAWGEEVIGTTTDDLGIPYVVRYVP